MKSTNIRQKMHSAIDLIEDKDFLRAIHVILNEKSKEYTHELSPGEKKEPDSLRKQYKSLKTKSYSVAEVRDHVYTRRKK